MRLAETHRWNVTPVEARALQIALRGRVDPRDRLGPLHRVAGVDVAFPRRGRGREARAAVAVLDFPSLAPVETITAAVPVSFPYVPGLLSFREIPAILAALERLSCLPDLLLCDGQGLAHPRRFGLACHLGVLLGLPTIGVAKTRLVGSHAPVPQARGAWTPLEHEGEVVGAVVRTREGVKPVYVSPGHRISVESAVARVMDCVTRFRLPETTRAADRAAGMG